jgi:hypothetical protein
MLKSRRLKLNLNLLLRIKAAGARARKSTLERETAKRIQKVSIEESKKIIFIVFVQPRLTKLNEVF